MKHGIGNAVYSGGREYQSAGVGGRSAIGCCANVRAVRAPYLFEGP